MKSPRRPRRPLFLLPALAAILVGSKASAAFVISESAGLFVPSFRDGANTTYFGWSAGTWDGNADSVPPEATIPDVINGTPSINPGSLSGSSFLTQTGSTDIVSGSDNIYSSIGAVNSLGLQLFIPTAGVVGSEGFTTIIIQGSGMSGFGFALDGFGYGEIEGIPPEYVIGMNDSGSGQWWAKWVIPGNAASYTVNLTGEEGIPGGSVLSVTDMIVDTWYSPSAGATDTALVPEPSAMLLSALAGMGLLVRRRR